MSPGKLVPGRGSILGLILLVATGCVSRSIRYEPLGGERSQLEIGTHFDWRQARSTLEFFITGKDGFVEAGVLTSQGPEHILDVEPGDYTVRAKHDNKGSESFDVIVKAGQKTVLFLRGRSDPHWLWTDEGTPGERLLKAAVRYALGILMLFGFAFGVSN